MYERCFIEFEKLLQELGRCMRIAKALSTPNPDDNDCIRLAIVGFSLYEKTTRWGREHYEIVKTYLQESDEAGLPDSAKRYSALAMGTMLGLFSVGAFSELEYEHACAVLPGFVFGHLNEIEKNAVV